MTTKKQSAYIPVTMDELMARFVTNMERNDCKERFREEKKILTGQSLCGLGFDQIEDGVRLSFGALKDLLSNNTIDMERMPNSENNLYLKLMERAQEENKLTLMNIRTSKICNLVKTKKPDHLIKEWFKTKIQGFSLNKNDSQSSLKK